MSKVTQIVHGAKQIVQIDFNGCTPGQFAPIIEEAQRAILGSPPGSVLALTLVENVRFDPATVIEMQRFVSRVGPHLKANAIVGITGMKKVVFGGIKPLYRAPVELFDTVAPAKDWLSAR
jgi:hypothetical protein